MDRFNSIPWLDIYFQHVDKKKNVMKKSQPYTDIHSPKPYMIQKTC